MNRKFIAAVLLAILTVLGGLDFFEDTGLIHYSTNEMDRSVEDVLDNYGEAIRSTENTPNDLLSRTLSAFCSLAFEVPTVAFPAPAYDQRRKQNIDFAKSAVDSFAFSHVLLV